MGILQRIFGRCSTSASNQESLSGMIATLIHMADLFLKLRSKLNNPKQRFIIISFYFGFVDAMGQSTGLPTEERLVLARSVFRTAFEMSDSEAEATVSEAIKSSQMPEGRRYMMEGGQALGKYLAKKATTPGNTRLAQLLAEVE